MQRRTPINVYCECTIDGISPVSVELASGQVYPVEEVVDVADFPGVGTRYSSRIHGAIRYLWHIHDKWYVYGDVNCLYAF